MIAQYTTGMYFLFIMQLAFLSEVGVEIVYLITAIETALKSRKQSIVIFFIRYQVFMEFKMIVLHTHDS